MHKPALIAGALISALGSHASAQLIVPLSETRELQCSADTDDLVHFASDSDMAVSTLYEYFSDNVSARAEIDNGLADSGAAQDSILGSTYIMASGSAFATGESYDFIVLSTALSSSIATVEFELTAKASYHWHGQISASDNGVADISFFGANGFNTGMTAFGPSEMFTIDETGVLDPGVYTFDVRAFGSAYAEGAEFDYSFADYQMALELTPLSSRFCTAAVNSAGTSAELSVGGSQSVAADDFRVEGTGAIPGGFGLVFYGPGQVQIPFGDGFRCVGGQTHRVQPPVLADPTTGFVSKPISFTTGPASSGDGQITPDSTWNFQLWYRDPMGPGGSGFNLSNGLSVTFCE